MQTSLSGVELSAIVVPVEVVAAAFVLASPSMRHSADHRMQRQMILTEMKLLQLLPKMLDVSLSMVQRHQHTTYQSSAIRNLLPAKLRPSLSMAQAIWSYFPPRPGTTSRQTVPPCHHVPSTVLGTCAKLLESYMEACNNLRQPTL